MEVIYNNHENEIQGAVTAGQPTQDEIILSVRDVVKTYTVGDGGTLTVLDHVNLELPKGKLIMFMGRSGSGKTTLMNLLSTLDDVTSGDIGFYDNWYSGMSVNEKEKLRRNNIGFVFQTVALIPVMTAYENVDFGLRTAGVKDTAERAKRIGEVLELVGLADRAKHFPAELSGGERQRVAIARAMAHKPELLFADEPTGALDTATGIYIAELFRKLTRVEGFTVIMTTHDVRLSELADVLIRL